MSIINAYGLHKYYNKNRRGEVHVLNGIDLSLPDTGLVCLLGESGSGKTTLLNALGRLDDFASGTQEVNGTRLRGRLGRASERVRSRLFGYVFQNYFLLEEATVRENLSLALRGCGLTLEEEETRIAYVLEAVDMYAYRKRRVDMLSGGQRQRVAIARALIKSPAVIFADEPTGNLDEARTVQIMNILRRVSATCLVVLATHEKELAELFADRIITIKDGRVTGDRAASPEATYRLSGDDALYLDEYRHVSAASDAVSVDYYARADEPLKLTVVRDRGRLYISVPEGTALETVTSASAVRFKVGPRPVLDRETAADFTFDLPRPKASKGSQMRFRELWRAAAKGLGAMGKRLVIPAIALVLISVLSTVFVADYLTLSNPDKESFITSDSRYLAISVETRGTVPLSERTDTVRAFLNEMEENAPEHLLWMQHNSAFTYEGGQTFLQISRQSDKFSTQTFVPLEFFDETTLLYGRPPAAPNEVVVDRWLLEGFMARKTTLSQAILSVRAFLGQRLDSPRNVYPLFIVGICDSGQPSIYVDRTAGLSFSSAGVNVATLSALQAAYPGRFDDVTLNRGECLISDSRGSIPPTYHHQAGPDYVVRGAFPAEFPAEFVIDGADTGALTVEMAATIRSFCAFTNDKESFKAWLMNGVSGELADKLYITVKDTYAERMAERMTTIRTQLRSRLLIMGAAAAMAAGVLYLMMRYNARANLRTIAVYRLMGISKRAILSLYGLQILLLSAVTVLPAAILTAGVLAVLNQISLLELNFIVSVPLTAAAAGAILAFTLLAALLPVAQLLRLPPAKLAAPYDM
ncbi:MAG: ATP-binding cassette domain-containing protein [Eubacteriales bacterium]|nr:ATP-binding cassette domain-containing protein [Eubacteriales bacterium]